jgi:hypothetical protein
MVGPRPSRLVEAKVLEHKDLGLEPTARPGRRTVLIGLLVVFEATSACWCSADGRRTQFGYIGVIAFYSLLWLFGPEIVWVLIALPATLLLLRAERRAVTAPAPTPPVEEKPGRSPRSGHSWPSW